MDAEAFYRVVRDRVGTLEPQEATRGTAAVFHVLRDRLTPDEAEHVAAQLPGPLRTVWEAGERLGREPIKMHRGEFYERVKTEASLRSSRAAEWLTLAVFGALKAQLSPGEVDDVLAQLPKDLKEVWVEAV